MRTAGCCTARYNDSVTKSDSCSTRVQPPPKRSHTNSSAVSTGNHLSPKQRTRQDTRGDEGECSVPVSVDTPLEQVMLCSSSELPAAEHGTTGKSETHLQ